jgi:hypothetical protein
MRTIKFYDIPEHIKSLVFDGDKTDLRLHDQHFYNWAFDNQEDYEKQEADIDKFKIKGEGYEVYMWCDVSGFEYWTKYGQDLNYIQVSISFFSEVLLMDSLNQLYLDLDTAMSYADELSNH